MIVTSEWIETEKNATLVTAIATLRPVEVDLEGGMSVISMRQRAMRRMRQCTQDCIFIISSLHMHKDVPWSCCVRGEHL